jgi:hypothetical protein
MDEPETEQPKIVSRFGHHLIEWDQPTLETVLLHLQSERRAHHIDIENRISEVGHDTLLARAELIKNNATHITPMDGSA